MNSDEGIEQILSVVPEFAARLATYRDDWAQDQPGFYLEMAEFGRFFCEVAEKLSDEQKSAIFGLVEQLVRNGDDEVGTAATTCFLENLQNYSSAGRINANHFAPFLGPESRAYCKAWDEFTGVSTPGL
jgi:hypothetical protein